MNTISHLKRAVDVAGSQKALAEQIGVQPQLIWAWINRGNVPVERCTAIEQATNGQVTRKDLRPDDWEAIWPELADKKAA